LAKKIFPDFSQIFEKNVLELKKNGGNSSIAAGIEKPKRFLSTMAVVLPQNYCC
jgi:hypothetical protein